MNDSVEQEVDTIVSIMLKKTKVDLRRVLSLKSFFVYLKILACVFVVMSFLILVANILIGINSYIKFHGVDLTVASVIIAFLALNAESTSFVKNYFLMYHLKNDTKVQFIITALQEKVVDSKMSIISIDIVEHKCQTYLQIRYNN